MLDYPVGMYVVGISSTTYAARAADQQNRSFNRFLGSKTPILIDIGGQSDLLASLTAAQILTAMETYHTSAKLAGATKTIACTIPGITAAWGFTGAMETQRLALNSSILSSTVFDEVADLASVPEASDPNDTTYFSDGLHPKSVLASLFADEIAPLV